MNKKLSYAIWVAIVGFFCICFLGGFFLTWKLVRTNDKVIPTTPIQLNPSIFKNDAIYEIATTDIDGKLVLGDIQTGKTLLLDIEPLSYGWSPNSKWLYATDYQQLWLINAEGNSVQQITANLGGAWISWSPRSNLLAFWLTEGLVIYNLDTESYFTLQGTESYNCNFSPSAWSFDQAWIIFQAAVCDENTIESDIVTIRVEGSETRLLQNNFYSNTPYPSTSDYRIVFAASKPDGKLELYLSDFRTLDTSLYKINDPEGRQQFWIKWLSDGSGFYSIPFNWWYPEVDFIDPATNKITVIWKDEQATQYPGDEWSPKGTKIVNRYKGLIIFDIGTGTFSEWEKGLTNVCGIQWNQDDEIVAVVVCEASGDLPVSEMNIILNDGIKIRFGDDLYGGAVEISSVQP